MSLLQEIRTRQALNEVGRFDDIKVFHAEMPKTIIGNKEYTLIFPHSITNFAKDKTINISFTGKITKKRERFLNRLLSIYGEAFINDSMNGRDKHKKIFDESYFEMLGVSRFVACPDGDFTWSYRFFEAILCKAIPIIESDSPLYEGYKFYRLGDKLEYRQDWIDHNLAKIKKEMML